MLPSVRLLSFNIFEAVSEHHPERTSNLTAQKYCLANSLFHRTLMLHYNFVIADIREKISFIAHSKIFGYLRKN